MAGNQVTLTFGGDATELTRASQQAEQATDGVADSVTSASEDMAAAGGSSADLGTKLGHLGGAVSGATDAIDSIGGSLTAVNDLMNLSANRAAEQKRKLLDVEQAAADLEQAYGDLEQAQLDLTQSMLDAKQGGIDAEQALIDAQQATLDAAEAQKAYNDAVKEHGKGSAEAQQAAIDLRQAQADLTQANLDGEQAQADIKQAAIDGGQATRDATQASIDARTAQLDLNDAMLAAHPPELQKWAENLQLVTPIITAVVGVLGLITAAQWLWNASLWASPVTWIVLAIITLVAIIVIIATQTTWFQDIWSAAWGGIKDAAEAVGTWFRDVLWGVYIKGTWDGIVTGVTWLKDQVVLQFTSLKQAASQVGDFLGSIPGKIGSAFKSVTNFIFAPFRAAFNLISSAWNATVGRLSWTVPSWVPFVGGNSISAPKLPTYHTGGIVSGALGSETLAVLQAGERVTPVGGGGGHSEPIVIRSGGSRMDDLLVELLQNAIERRGGDPVRVLSSARG